MKFSKNLQIANFKVILNLIMSGLFKEIPQYLREEYQLTATVMFTAFFSLVFMLFSIPFSHNAWFELATGRAFGYTVAFFAIGLLVIIFSKRLMYLSRNKIRMNYLQYVLWNFAEVVAICLLYALFSIRGNANGIIRLQNASFVSIFFNALLYCFTSLVVPYVIAGMYFAIIDKNNTIRLMNYSDTVSDEPETTGDAKKITVFDNKGTMSLSVSLSNLYFIESDDNYIKVWYTDSSSRLRSYFLRCRMKTVEESFKGSSLMRCHRKYIVNIDKVRALSRGVGGGYSLLLDIADIPPVPVSKTYEQSILESCGK